MKNTSKAALISITRNLNRLQRLGDENQLRAYLCSDVFVTVWLDLEPVRRATVMKLGAKALAACARKSKVPKPGTVKANWRDPAFVAKFSRAYARTGTYQGAAAICGITVGAARIGYRRYVAGDATYGIRAAA